jgi:hypothetical protein
MQVTSHPATAGAGVVGEAAPAPARPSSWSRDDAVTAGEAAEAGRRIVAGREELTVSWWATTGPAAPADSDYAERFVLPLVGPTTFLLGRTLARVADEARRTLRPVPVPLARLGEALGVGVSTGRCGILSRSMGRLVLFGLARADDDGAVLVRTDWPVLGSWGLRHLPGWLRVAHDLELVADELGRR